MSNDEATFAVLGMADFPMVEVYLEPECSICAEPGRMVQLPEGVHFHAQMGNGDEAGMWAKLKVAGSRMLPGEDVVLARFTNETNQTQTLRFGTVVPGHILPLKLSDWGGEIIGMSGVYLIGSDSVRVQCCFRQTLGAAFFGGESFILQKISGDGNVILQGGGTIIAEELTPERPYLKIDSSCLVAFTSGLQYDVTLAGGLKSWIFGGEGIFLATIRLSPGQQKGTVWIETFPYKKFINKIIASYPNRKSNSMGMMGAGGGVSTAMGLMEMFAE